MSACDKRPSRCLTAPNSFMILLVELADWILVVVVVAAVKKDSNVCCWTKAGRGESILLGWELTWTIQEVMRISFVVALWQQTARNSTEVCAAWTNESNSSCSIALGVGAKQDWTLKM